LRRGPGEAGAVKRKDFAPILPLRFQRSAKSQNQRIGGFTPYALLFHPPLRILKTMTIEQTIDIPADHYLHLALPLELPVGRARVELTITPESAAAAAAAPVKLSERFAGALRLSGTQYAAFQTAIQQGRNEWNERC
jgi:hypothetical protein